MKKPSGGAGGRDTVGRGGGALGIGASRGNRISRPCRTTQPTASTTFNDRAFISYVPCRRAGVRGEIPLYKSPLPKPWGTGCRIVGKVSLTCRKAGELTILEAEGIP